MASIVGGLAVPHAPQLIMPARHWSDLPIRTRGPFIPKASIALELSETAKRAKELRCHEALEILKGQLFRWHPDALIVLGDDQHENITDDNRPPFLIYMAPTTDATLHFLYCGDHADDQVTSYEVAADFAFSLLEGLMEADFDPAWSTRTREETGLGHAFGRPLKFLMPHRKFPVVPILVNTSYPPAPSARRCLNFGKAIHQVIKALPGDMRVVLLASGGMSHYVIDEQFDAIFISALERYDENYLSAISSSKLVSGTSELRTWIIVAGAMQRGARMVDYVPCYRDDKGIGCAMGFAVWE